MIRLALVLLLVGRAALGASLTLPTVTVGGSSAARPFAALHTYFMAASGCSDANLGSAASPWCSVNHSLVCGDVIVAVPGNYSASAFNTWGGVSNCPSTSGGIDGAGGIWFAISLCGGVDLNSCTVTASGGGLLDNHGTTMKSNWAMEGWTCTGGASARCFVPRGCTSMAHHIALINDIAFNTAQGYGMNDCGTAGGQGVNSVDYYAVVGSIAQNAAQDQICLAAIDVVGPGQFDSNPGTHFYLYGDFSYANTNAHCRTISDTEGFMFDTWDFHNVATQGVIANNIGYGSDRMGVQLFYQSKSADAATMKIVNNTFFQNNTNINTDFANGEININRAGSANLPWLVTIQDNIAYQPLAGGGHKWAYVWGPPATVIPTIGGAGHENVFSANNSSCPSTCDPGRDIVSFAGASYLGVNTYTKPLFDNTADLLSNRMGAPNCTGFPTTTACMGWDATTGTLTTPSVISDLRASCAGCAGKGYQLPSTTCAANPDYPTWLKGIVHLHWDGSALTEVDGLVNKPCGL